MNLSEENNNVQFARNVVVESVIGYKVVEVAV
jgi:hypothetical protein